MISVRGVLALLLSPVRSLPVHHEDSVGSDFTPRVIRDAIAPSAQYYNEFWVGAVAGSDISITSAWATITVPEVSIPQGQDALGFYEAVVFVGLDGYGSCNGLLQALLGWRLDNGNVRYYVAHQYPPDETKMVEYPAEDFPMKPGDRIKLQVHSQESDKGPGCNGGKTIITNLESNLVVKATYTNQRSRLCQSSADFILEAVTYNYTTPHAYRTPFPAFAGVVFTDVGYTTASRRQGLTKNVTLLDYGTQDSPETRTRIVDAGRLRVDVL